MWSVLLRSMQPRLWAWPAPVVEGGDEGSVGFDTFRLDPLCASRHSGRACTHIKAEKSGLDCAAEVPKQMTKDQETYPRGELEGRLDLQLTDVLERVFQLERDWRQADHIDTAIKYSG